MACAVLPTATSHDPATAGHCDQFRTAPNPTRGKASGKRAHAMRPYECSRRVSPLSLIKDLPMPNATEITSATETITMPQLGESVTEGRLGRWLKEVGERVEKYEPLVEVETDKVNSEIPSPYAGTLINILVPENTTVPVGTGICTIGAPETAERAASEPILEVSGTNGDRPEEVPNDIELLRARSSPVVRRIAAE